jgi:predicted DCC family thiol-disulfide oxidoreductase YuxK
MPVLAPGNMVLMGAFQMLNALPDPDKRPGSDVVIFDGQCRICTGQIERLARWDRGGRLSYLSLHDPRVAARYPDLSHDALMKELYVVDRQGMRHAGAAAIRYLSRRLPALWWLAPLLHLPGTLPVWNWLYQQVAKRRYRFGRVETCEGGTCHLHGGMIDEG